MRFAAYDQGEAKDPAERIVPGNWMNQPSVAAVKVVAVAVYVHERDTAGSVGLILCPMGQIQCRLDVIWMEESTAQVEAVDTTQTPGQNGEDLFQGAYAAWGEDTADDEWTVTELEEQSGWVEARRGQQQCSSSRCRYRS